MALDDLLKGISVFQKGVSDLAVSQGINQANQAVMQLQQQALSEQEKMAAQNQIAQGLAGRLVQAGASAAHIEQATQRIGLTAPQQTSVDQSNKQSDIQQDQFAQEMAFKWASLRDKKSGEKLNKLQENMMGTQGKALGEAVSNLPKVEEQLTLLDEAIDSTINYTQKSVTGTGPFANLFGIKSAVDPETEALEAKYNLINVKNMAQVFEGMSKAVDSETERKAWEITQASTKNREATNAQILVGQKAIALKTMAETQARKAWVEEHGDLNKYKSPVIGKVMPVVDSETGEMKLVPKAAAKMLTQKGMGFMSVDDYTNNWIAKGKKPGKKMRAAPAVAPPAQSSGSISSPLDINKFYVPK